jgi:hypothetical protein
MSVELTASLYIACSRKDVSRRALPHRFRVGLVTRRATDVHLSCGVRASRSYGCSRGVQSFSRLWC